MSEDFTFNQHVWGLLCNTLIQKVWRFIGNIIEHCHEQYILNLLQQLGTSAFMTLRHRTVHRIIWRYGRQFSRWFFECWHFKQCRRWIFHWWRGGRTCGGPKKRHTATFHEHRYKIGEVQRLWKNIKVYPKLCNFSSASHSDSHYFHDRRYVLTSKTKRIDFDFNKLKIRNFCFLVKISFAYRKKNKKISVHCVTEYELRVSIEKLKMADPI